MTGIIFNIQRFSINDGPGIRTTVFLKGCPLHCTWCHNPESISSKREILLRGDRCIRCGSCIDLCEHNAIQRDGEAIVTSRDHCIECGTCIDSCYAGARVLVGAEMSTEKVMSEIMNDVVFYDESGGGATFSGGEPFLQHEFLIELLRSSKKNNLHTAVDTSGYVSPEILKNANQFIDLYLYDIKAINDDVHRAFTGVSNRLILDNLKRLIGWHKEIIVRVPVIPSINDDLDEIRQIGNFIKNTGGITEIHLLPYHQSGIPKYHRLGNQYGMGSPVPPSGDTLKGFADELKKYVPHVNIGG